MNRSYIAKLVHQRGRITAVRSIIQQDADIQTLGHMTAG